MNAIGAEGEKRKAGSAVAKSVVKSFALGNVCARNPTTAGGKVGLPSWS